MMKLPGHVPQGIACVWSCSEFLISGSLDNVVLQVYSLGEKDYKFLVLLVFIADT